MAVSCCENSQSQPLILGFDHDLPGTIIGVSGTMGSGKSTFVRILTGQTEGLSLEGQSFIHFHHRLLLAHARGQFGLDLTGQIRIIPSYTDRPPRGDEINGEYVHLSTTEFLARTKEGFFSWWVRVGPCHYGTSQADIISVLEQGLLGVMNITPDTVIEHIEPSWFNERGKFRALYVNSNHRALWMAVRGGLSEEEIKLREERNCRWDELVKESQGVAFCHINNNKVGDLKDPVLDLVSFLGRI